MVAEYDAQLSECAAVGGIDRIITLLLIQMNCIALLWRIVLIHVVVAGVRSLLLLVLLLDHDRGLLLVTNTTQCAVL